jgi:hypothetical protein
MQVWVGSPGKVLRRNHVTRIANARRNPSCSSSHGDVRRHVSSEPSDQKHAGVYDNPLRHDLWRAGHAQAGVYLALSLIMLRYVDEAVLSPFWKWLARTGAPIAAILIPAAFFLSVASPTATQPNGLINLAYLGALFLAAAVLSLGVGLIRAARRMER